MTGTGESRAYRCTVCSERIVRYANGQWRHVHSDDVYCGTGDGATAFPPPEQCIDLGHHGRGCCVVCGALDIGSTSENDGSTKP